jgi:hypothetical protein
MLRNFACLLILVGPVGACAIDDGSESEASGDFKLAVKATATVTLSASSDDAAAPVSIQFPDNSTVVCNPCNVTFPQGSTAFLHLTEHVDKANCLTFNRWLGACAGQLAGDCELVMNQDLSTDGTFKLLLPCTER